MASASMRLKRNRLRKFTCARCGAIVYHAGFTAKTNCIHCGIPMQYAGPVTEFVKARLSSTPDPPINAEKEPPAELRRPATAVQALPISRRAMNALLNAGFLYYEELQQLSIAELYQIRGLGAGTVDELVALVRQRGDAMGVVTSLDFMGIYERPHVDAPSERCRLSDVSALPAGLRTNLGRAGIDCFCKLCSLNFPQLSRLLEWDRSSTGAVMTALELAGYHLVGRARQSVPQPTFENLTTQAEPEEPTKLPISLSDELWLLTLPAGGHENRKRAAAFFAWDGLRGGTLQQIGDRFGVTRQRVQQVVRRVEARAQGIVCDFPFLKAALSAVGECAPCDRQTAEGRLQRAAGRALSVEGLLNAARLARLEPRVEIWPEDRNIVVATNASAALTIVVRTAKKAVAHHGLVTVAEVVAQAGVESEIPEEVVRRALALLPDFDWIDETGGWFWLRQISNNRLINQIKKCFAASSRLSVTELRHALSRHPELQGNAAPRKALFLLCQRLPFCKVDGEYVVAVDHPVGELLTDPERAYIALVRESGPILSRPQIEQAMSGPFTNPTIVNLLTHSPLVKKFAYNSYGVVGDEPGDSALNREETTERQKTLEDYGWGDDGRLWITYRLSRSTIVSGMITVPAAVKKVLQGDYKVRDEEGVDLGTLRVRDSASAWGLAPFFRRRGGEPDDYLRIDFDLALRSAAVRVAQDLP